MGIFSAAAVLPSAPTVCLYVPRAAAAFHSALHESRHGVLSPGSVRRGVSVSAPPDLHGQLQQLRQILPSLLNLQWCCCCCCSANGLVSVAGALHVWTCCRRLMTLDERSGMAPHSHDDLQCLCTAFLQVVACYQEEDAKREK